MIAPALVLAGHQPAYLPWPGYLSRLLDVERFLLLDHVQYSRGWQHRNYIAGPRSQRRLTVPVTHRFGQRIDQARIADDVWRGRHWRILQETYRHAEFWPQWALRLAAVYDRRWDRLTDLNQAVLELLLEGFGIQIRVLRSSDLQPQGRKTQMLIDLCRLTDSRALRVGAGALDYLDFAALTEAGIGVQIATYSHPPYSRGRQPFIPGLSALDLLLHQGPGGSRILSHGAQLTTWTGAIGMTGLVNSVPWIAVEGTNATGKTHLARQVIDALGPRCLLLTELPDTPAALLPGRIIEALHTSGDPFLRTGVPRTETLLLAALQVHRHETALPRPGQVVLEDRGPHSVAVYQAVILCSDDADDELLPTARIILELIMRWRPLPPRVLLLVDDPDTCLARFEQRAGRAARVDEKLLMRRVGYLYGLLADLDPARFQVIDRRLLNEQQCVAAIVDACHAAVLGEQPKDKRS